jgi:hypothetical protein
LLSSSAKRAAAMPLPMITSGSLIPNSSSLPARRPEQSRYAASTKRWRS